MFRALRCDKLVYGAMEAALRHTLFCQWDKLPALHIVAVSTDQIKARAEDFAADPGGAHVSPDKSVIGGGSTPDQALPTWVVVVEGDAVALERELRKGDPAVVARIKDDRLVLDLRTVFEEEQPKLLEALRLVRDQFQVDPVKGWCGQTEARPSQRYR